MIPANARQGILASAALMIMALTVGMLVVACANPVGGKSDDDSPADTPLSSAKAITAFSLADAGNTFTATGVIAESAHTIAVTLPYGKPTANLIATFTTTGESVKIGSKVQASAKTANNFSSPITYTVVAADSSTQNYVVKVIVAPKTAKAITAFGFVSPSATGTIAEAGHAIAVTVPYGTDVSALVATFSTTGKSVKVGDTHQVSGTTANDFSAPVIYTVAAADASTQDYTVTVTVAPATAKEITAFGFPSVSAAGTIDEATRSIFVPLPASANTTNLVAAFSTTGQSVKIGGAAQVSGSTANNFSAGSLTYTVTAGDGSVQEYTVTVLRAPGNLTGLPASNSQINLSWTDNSANESGFSIERATTGNGPWSTAGSVAANATTFSDTGRPENYAYYYRVSAIHALGSTSPHYATVSSYVHTLPSAPSNLQAAASMPFYDHSEMGDPLTVSFKITFTWTRNSTAGASIKFSTDGGATYNLTSPQDYDGSLVVWRLEDDEGMFAYFQELTTYRAYAENHNGPLKSTPSNTVSFTTPLYRPYNQEWGYTMPSNNPVITIYDLSSKEDGYSVEMSTTGAEGTFSVVGTRGAIAGAGNEAEFTDTTTVMAKGQIYYYRVRAYKGTVYSEYAPACQCVRL